MIETQRVLFAGRLGNQRVRVWLEPHAGAIRMLSHDIGSGLELAFGKDEIETFLEIEAAHVPNLAAALRAERSEPIAAPKDAIELLVDKYRGDSTATSALRAWLTARGIPYRFTIV